MVPQGAIRRLLTTRGATDRVHSFGRSREGRMIRGNLLLALVCALELYVVLHWTMPIGPTP